MLTPSALETLPSELALYIFRSLETCDLVSLMRVCKGTNALVQPLLWSSIELHLEDYHECLVELQYPPPFIPTTQRCYLPTLINSFDEENVAKILLTMLKSLETNNKGRLRQVAERVVNLCTPVDPSAGHPTHLNMGAEKALQCWHIMTYFTNLQSLELHGVCVSDEGDDHDMPPIAAPPIPNLRFAKLTGYMPAPFVAWVLQSGATLERLELQLLDRPITDRRNRDLDWNALPEENLRFGEKGQDGEDAESDYGSLYEEKLVPRPLSGFVPINIADSKLPNLKHLYLGRPSKWDHGGLRDEDGDYTLSSRADAASLADWRQLLLASSETLEVLVLEQRPAAVGTEADTALENSHGFMRLQMERGTGIESASLVDMAKGVLLQKGAFPNLRELYLYGIQTCRSTSTSPSHSLPGGQLMWLLKGRGVRCEARLGRWFQYDEYSGVATSEYGPGFYQYGSYTQGQIDWDALLASV